MRDETDLLRRIREDTELSMFLAVFPEFDVNRRHHGDDQRLASGEDLEVIAGDGTGGAFYLSGERASPRPVIYASSEGDAGVLARSLPEALELMIGFPYWRDCLGYSNDGDLDTMQAAAVLLQRDLLDNHPDADAEQSRAAELIGLERKPVPVLVQQLRSAVLSVLPEFVFCDAIGEYGDLFGPFEPSRNFLWQGGLG
jgi:hypothetical protein